MAFRRLGDTLNGAAVVYPLLAVLSQSPNPSLKHEVRGVEQIGLVSTVSKRSAESDNVSVKYSTPTIAQLQHAKRVLGEKLQITQEPISMIVMKTDGIHAEVFRITSPKGLSCNFTMTSLGKVGNVLKNPPPYFTPELVEKIMHMRSCPPGPLLLLGIG